MDGADMPEAKRILIVDDDPDVHNLLRIALDETGCYLESAFDGLAGLKKVEEAQWDLVITDVIMGGMDGLELLERVRGIRPHMPVVVMTVDTTAEKIISAIRGNAFSWFRKPFAPQAVRDARPGVVQTQDDDAPGAGQLRQCRKGGSRVGRVMKHARRVDDVERPLA